MAGMEGFTPDALESVADGEAVRTSLGAALDLRVAEALADYCDKIVNVMQLCGKRFSERADKNGVSDAFRRQIVTLYKLVLQARRAASEFYVFSKAHRTAELKEEVDKTRKKSADDLEGKAAEVERTVAALLDQVPEVDLESKAFLHKVRGDFYAFWARVAEGEARDGAVAAAKGAYADALAGPKRAERDATRLGAIFSRAVFEADICGDTAAALALVRDRPTQGEGLTPEHAEDCGTIEALLAEAEVRWAAPPVVTAATEPEPAAAGPAEAEGAKPAER